MHEGVTVHEVMYMYMMLLGTLSLSTASHLVGLVGPYKQPYSKTLSLNRARYSGVSL